MESKNWKISSWLGRISFTKTTPDGHQVSIRKRFGYNDLILVWMMARGDTLWMALQLPSPGDASQKNKIMHYQENKILHKINYTSLYSPIDALKRGQVL
jgi:hypothetical protein